jgi:hydrogenase maturation protease
MDHSWRAAADAGAPITVVGAGNWLISCDRIGPRVLELCTGRFGDDVELFESGSAGLALLDCIRGQELMLVVDACKGGCRSGEIRIIEMEYPTDLPYGPSMHQFGPLETLAIASHLYPEKLPRQTRLIVVETEGLNETELEDACGRVLTVLSREIAVWRGHHAKGDSLPTGSSRGAERHVPEPITRPEPNAADKQENAV